MADDEGAGEATGEGPLAELRREYGVDARRIDAVGALLTGGAPRTVDELVSLTGSSRRTVEAVLRALGLSGDTVRLTGEHPGFAAPPVPADPWDAMAAADPGLLTEAAGLVAAAPPPLRDLDHVPATPHTVLKRAHYLLRAYDLRGAHVLCVGDHDLTSLALFLAGGAEGLRVSVADIDERLLGFIGATAAARGWDVRCHFADLRLGLPPGLRESAGLVFTDPPYTPEGIALFVTRGLQGLADHRSGRVLVAYGFGERQPALGLAVQEALASLHLVYEAVLPGFNRYTGAQAIGSAAALYVLRPTRRSAPAAAGDIRGTLYTHGAQSVESAGAALTAAGAKRVLDRLGDPRPQLFGAGFAGGRPLRALFAAPPAQGRAAAAVDLTPSYGASAGRALLAVNAETVALVCPSPEPPDVSCAPKYEITERLRDVPEPGMSLVLAVRRTGLGGAGRVLASVQGRAHGRIANTWREGLIDLARAEGRSLTKAEARARIEARPALLDLTPLDLPEALGPELAEAVERSVAPGM